VGIFPQTLVGQVFNLSLRRWDDCAPTYSFCCPLPCLGDVTTQVGWALPTIPSRLPCACFIDDVSFHETLYLGRGRFCLLVGIIWAGLFYWRHLRGVGPALTAPPQDIAQLMAKAGKNEAPASAAKNTTGYPLQLPPGFSISIFAKDLGKPRVLALDSSGALLASIPSQGRIVALPEADGDGVSDNIVTVVDGLDRPHGFAFHPRIPKSFILLK